MLCTCHPTWHDLDKEQVFQELLDDELDAISRIPADRDQALRFVRDELDVRPTSFHSECEGVVRVQKEDLD